ncbi:MAG: class I SAM-dependent methyltransferase, partial [Marinibacterium sp.]|nr:class I SAM-dependent methyltransferase [Marinibacterium sp.]
NTAWGDLARQNMGRIGTRFTLTSGPVEAHGATLPEVIDIALIDAIHQTDVVLQQMALLRPRCRAGSLIILDDINFSPDMQQGWQTIAARSDFREAWQIGARTGIVVV